MKSGSDKIWAITSGIKKSSNKASGVNSYYIEIKPILVLLRGFGRFPYSFKENGVGKFRAFSLPALYSVAFYLAQTGWTCYALRELVITKVARSKSYDETLYWISLGIFNLQNFAVPITNWMESTKIVNYINLWHDLQEEFGSGGFKLKLKLPVLVGSILLLPMTFGIILTQSFLLREASVVILLPYLTSIGSGCLFLLLWAATLHEIRSMSRSLFQSILKDGFSEIGGKRLVWLRLSGLATALGETIGQTGLTYLVLLFATFVPTSYGLLAFFFDHAVTSHTFWGLLMSACFCFISKFLICDAAHRTTQQVGESFSEEILQQDLTSLPPSNANEVVLFLQTMAANPPDIQLHGFVTVSRGLFVSFVSNTVTYLVVLLQFKASSLALTPSSNSTTTSSPPVTDPDFT